MNNLWRRGIMWPTCQPGYDQEERDLIEMRDAMRAVKSTDPDAIVVTGETANMAFADVSDPNNNPTHLPVGAMSKASNVALGVAMAQPDRNVIVFDGDGCILMNLGALVTTSKAAPRNMVHIVLENDCYALTGGQPLPSTGVSDLPGIAREAGYKNVYQFDDAEQFATELPAILNAKNGPVFISLATETEITVAAEWRNYPRPPKPWKQAAPAVREYLAGQ
ncbi:MAG: thiamine pyrophosphate-dependent enzyme [Chloroflexota bacterium]